MKKKKQKVKKQKSDRTMIAIKLSQKDLTKLKSNAKWFAGGNLSEWLRYAGEHFVPSSAQEHEIHDRTASKLIDKEEDFF